MQKARKIKILFVLPTLGAGGAERVLITLLNNIDKEQFTPIFLAFNEEGTARDWIAEDIPFYTFGNKSVRKSLLPLIAFIREHKPDILFTTMVHTNALACVMKIIFTKLKVIIRESSIPTALLNEYGTKGKICKFVYRFLYPFADKVISPARLIVEEFNQVLGIKNLRHQVIYNPVDTDKIYPFIPQEFERFDGVRFVAVGRVAREKGLVELISALEKKNPEGAWRLDIIGDGDQRGKLEELIVRLGLQEHIFIHGYHAKPWNIGAKGDCLILPSLWEGMPNVALEALACGLPVIAMKSAGAIAEIAQAAQGGDVRIASNYDEFVEMMCTVKQADKTSRAESKLPELFTLEHVIQQYQDCFERV